jgi:hypothetical protein
MVEMYHVPSSFVPFCERLLEIDLEADPEYSGWAPASVSLKGLSREYGFRRLQDKEIAPKEWLRAAATPSIKFLDLAKRWNEISATKGLESNWTEEMGHKQVKSLIGYSE